MDKDFDQYHLKGKRFSGRGVRVRELDADEIDEAGLCAAKLLSKEANGAELSAKTAGECVRRMIVGVTKKGDLSTLDGAEWVDVTQQDLENEEGQLYFAKLFTSKDAQVLRSLHYRRHNATEEELAAIEGGAQAASAD